MAGRSVRPAGGRELFSVFDGLQEPTGGAGLLPATVPDVVRVEDSLLPAEIATDDGLSIVFVLLEEVPLVVGEDSALEFKPVQKVVGLAGGERFPSTTNARSYLSLSVARRL